MVKAKGKWIEDLSASTRLEDAARRVLSLRFEAVRDALGKALREPEKDPEHIHQLRIGTRRAAAALKIFAPCLPNKVVRQAKTRLRDLRKRAGQARDWDVFLSRLPKHKSVKRDEHHSGIDFLCGFAVGQRLPAQEVLKQGCADYPFGIDRLLVDTVSAIQKPRKGDRRLVDVGRRVLKGLVSELNAATRQDLSDYDLLHDVRVIGKRLRYAMEVFGTCFSAPFREKVYPAVAEMQEILGSANDSYNALVQFEALGEKLPLMIPKVWSRYQPFIDHTVKRHLKNLPRQRLYFQQWWRQWKEGGIEDVFHATMKMKPEPLVESDEMSAFERIEASLDPPGESKARKERKSLIEADLEEALVRLNLSSVGVFLDAQSPGNVSVCLPSAL
jgi:CHAD domain-containing protein